MKDKNKIVITLAIHLGLMVAFCISSQIPKALGASNTDNMDPSLITPEIEKEINDYALGISDPNVFKGNFQDVLPFQSEEFTDYNLTFSESSKRSYAKNERLEVEGTLSYKNNIETAAKNFKKDCESKAPDKSKCLSSELYYLPSLQDTGLFVQIWRKDEDKQKALGGDFLVDEFYAYQGTQLKENDPQKFSINWKIPKEIRSGKYYLALTLNTSKNFDLWGTPLVAESAKKIFDFELNEAKETEEAGSGIELDKENIKINNTDYSYRSPAPEITPSENGEVTVSVPLVNLNPKDVSASVRYELFKWGQTDNTNSIDSKNETKSIESGEKAILSYNIKTNTLDSVYNLKITAKTDDSVTTSNIRFIISGKNKGIFRFLGLAEKQGISYPMFCVRDASWNGIFQGKVMIEMEDIRKNPIGTQEAEATIRPETRCFVATGIKTNTKKCLVVRGKIQNSDGKVVDEKEVTAPCGIESESKFESALKEIGEIAPFEGKKGWVFLFVVLALVVGGLIIYLNNKQKQR